MSDPRVDPRADLDRRRGRLSAEKRALLEKRLRGAGRTRGKAGAPPSPVGEQGLDLPATGPEAPAAFRDGNLWRELEQGARATGRRTLEDPELIAEAEDEPRVDRLAAVYIAGALRRLGLFAEAGESRTVTSVMESAGVSPSYPKVVLRWLEMLAEEGLLERRGDAFISPRPLPENAFEQLETKKERGLSVDVLTGILTGDKHALEYFLAGGSSTEIESAYREAPMFRFCNRICEELVRRLVERIPAGRPLRVLEIGAGTGGTTASLLPLLPPERTVYVYTDVSRYFTELGREKFAAYPFLRFRELDIERHPGIQELDAESFDLVVAAHVLHATRRIDETLEHVRWLLARGGLLLLLEETRFRRQFNFSMGFMPGFDRFEDLELRPLHPLLSAREWREALGAHGFEACLSSTEPGSHGEALGVDVLLARASHDPAAEPRFVRHAPLSFEQERLWAFETRHPRTACYNVAAPARLSGAVDPDLLERALGDLLRRQPVLATVFDEAFGGTLRQAILPRPAIELRRESLEGTGEESASRRAEELLADEASRPFDLARGPLARACLVRLAPEEHLFQLTAHHLITDGWSSTVLLRELATAYSELAAGRGGTPAMEPRYAAHARRQQEKLGRGRLGNTLAFWEETLSRPKADLALPIRRGRSENRGFGRVGIPLALGPEPSRTLRTLARTRRTTLFTTLLAAFMTYLRRFADGDEIEVMTPFSTRHPGEDDDLAGLFISMLPLRASLAEGSPFEEVMDRVSRAVAAAFAHPELPHRRLTEILGRRPDIGRVMFNRPPAAARSGSGSGSDSSLGAGGLRWEPRGSVEMGSEADLSLYAADAADEGMRFDLVYRVDLFERDQAEAMARELGEVLEAAGFAEKSHV